jgi:hypothetical protein
MSCSTFVLNAFAMLAPSFFLHDFGMQNHDVFAGRNRYRITGALLAFPVILPGALGKSREKTRKFLSVVFGPAFQVRDEKFVPQVPDRACELLSLVGKSHTCSPPILLRGDAPGIAGPDRGGNQSTRPRMVKLDAPRDLTHRHRLVSVIDLAECFHNRHMRKIHEPFKLAFHHASETSAPKAAHDAKHRAFDCTYRVFFGHSRKHSPNRWLRA